MGEYFEKAFSDVKELQAETNGSSVRYSLKGFSKSYLFSSVVTIKAEDFINKNISLSQEEKTNFLDFLKETIKSSYENFEIYTGQDDKIQGQIKQLIEDQERDEHLNWRKIIWGILVACLVCAGIVCLYFSLKQ